MLKRNGSHERLHAATLTPNEEKCGTRNLQAHRAGAAPAAGRSTPSLHLAANEAAFSRPLLWKESTDNSLAAAAHRLALENSGRPLGSSVPGADGSGMAKCRYITMSFSLKNDEAERRYDIRALVCQNNGHKNSSGVQRRFGVHTWGKYMS